VVLYRILFQSILLLFFISNALFSFEISPSLFLGLRPEITVEPFYEKGEFDVNIFPLIIQKPISEKMALQFSGILNVGVRTDDTMLSHYGLRLSLPIFPFLKDSEKPQQGLYVAPGMGFSRNRGEKHSNFGFWLEPGYQLQIDKEWAMIFGLQLGATHFSYDSGEKKWDEHFGLKVTFGKWFGLNEKWNEEK
jgi:hypothetical protein